MTAKKFFIGVLFIFHVFTLKAQDSSRVMTLQDFFSLILQNHPVAKQAEMLNERAKQELRISRGMLDPSLNSKLYQKEFQSKEYFTLWDTYLRVPTWYGIDFKAGFERNTGPYVSEENLTPLQGLSYLGISVPIGQGLFIDERRAQIKQALQFSTIAEAERIKIINKLLLQAAKDYWDWMYYYHKWNLYKGGLDLASLRYAAVSERARQGDISAIDTVEAMMQVQNFQILLTQSEVEYRNTSLILSNYLWNEEGAPVEITDQVIPSEVGSEVAALRPDSINALVVQARSNHPDLIKLNAKLIQLTIEKRFIADKFKPKLYLDYNLLQTGFPLSGEVASFGYLSNNYKVGASFSYPLFLRSERGKFQMTKLKMQETNYDLQQTNREIENSIRAAGNDWIALGNQIVFQESLVRNSEALRFGEQVRFENGESSVFLVNTREATLINNKIKLYEMKAKYAKSKVLLQWAAGRVQ